MTREERGLSVSMTCLAILEADAVLWPSSVSPVISYCSDLALTEPPRTGLCHTTALGGNWIKVTGKAMHTGRTTSYASTSRPGMQFAPLTCVNSMNVAAQF